MLPPHDLGFVKDETLSPWLLGRERSPATVELRERNAVLPHRGEPYVRGFVALGSDLLGLFAITFREGRWADSCFTERCHAVRKVKRSVEKTNRLDRLTAPTPFERLSSSVRVEVEVELV